ALGYMQIGLTDYLRFFTNKDKLNVENFVGVPALGPPLAMALGDPTIGERTDGKSADGKYILFGGGIRSNGDLKLAGPLNFYFSPARPIEGIQTTGKIKIETPDAANKSDQVFVNQIPNPPTIDVTRQVLPSDDKNRTTNQGYVRDGSSQSDPFGFPNGIPTLLPPILETKTDGTGVLRYRALTRDSGQWFNKNNQRYNTGWYGWGRGIYIDNFGDQQEETSRPGISGGYSLRADWLNPNAQFAQGYWQGPFYRPPGVLIELLGDRIRLTRSDDRSFRKPDGTPITALGGKVIEIPLSDLDRDNYVLPDGTPYPLPHLDRDGDEPDASDPTGANRPFGDKQSYGVNLVLMAEGNVRVKGAYGVVTDASGGGTTLRMGRVHLTIVSGGTAYIEGNVVKGDGYKGSDNVQHLERASTCAILANDYVCVNTTMFMTPENQTNVWTRVPGDIDAYDVAIGLSRPTFDMSWSFGVPYSDATYTTGGQPSPFFFLLRHASEYPGPSYLNLLINPAQTLDAGLNPLYQFNILGASPGTYILGQKFDPNTNTFLADDNSLFPSFEGRAFPLRGTNNGVSVGNFASIAAPGLPNLFRFQPDQTVQTLQGVSFAGATDYLLGSAMVAPMDIRIEALLYAQNNSFFVIPGYPLNPNPADTAQAYVANNNRRPSYRIDPVSGNLQDSPEEKQAKDIFPFYNDPVDVRITIYGAVAENYAASAGDQKAWMARWGYIPAQHGSSGIAIPDDHLKGHDPGPNVTGMDYGYVPGEDRDMDIRTDAEKSYNGVGIARGLRFIYDPALAMPYLNPADATLDGESGAAQALRQQRALRFHTWQLKNLNGEVLSTVRQILPPMPRLPVCPGLLYFGDPDRRIGT
ncbi:MAG TPA: hypothetical protein VFB21_02460, partial [Chthonomonadaceae bacterium]|nr:hypothetical protein [Chthonomonadaceae bacterium]